ncbi:MAG TPA: choice-of-anchor D domain-containing protein [Polyangia bacterium]|nr:choice-of-anchor D domain-containing protein [Polyangia bacterium]
MQYSDGGSTHTATRAVSGTPTARARVTVSEWFGPNDCTNCMPFDFGPVTVGSSVEQTFTVYNTGALPATSLAPAAGLNTPFAYKTPGGYPGNGGNCGTMLAAGNWCQVVVVFAPQLAGPASAMLSITYDDTFMSPLTASRALAGTGQ